MNENLRDLLQHPELMNPSALESLLFTAFMHLISLCYHGLFDGDLQKFQ